MRRSTFLLVLTGLAMLTLGCGKAGLSGSAPAASSPPSTAPGSEDASADETMAYSTPMPAESESAEMSLPSGEPYRGTFAEEPTSRPVPGKEPPVTREPARSAKRKAEAYSDTFAEESASRPAPSEGPRATRESDRPAKRDADRRQSRPSGQLTAGSIDDVQRADEFCQFLQQTLGAGMFADPVRDVRPRVMLEVATSDGRPVGGAELTVIPTSSQREGVRLTTGSDGRAMLTASDLDVQAQDCAITVSPPDGSRPVNKRLVFEENVCRIVLDDFQAERPAQLDLALIIDTTGSMGDELEYLKLEIDGIVARLRDTFPNVDQRFALVVYRDQGDQYVSRKFDFTGSLDDLRGELSQQHASGGGDYPEAVHVALQQAAGLDWRPGNVARVAFLVGDAPPHDCDMLAAFDATGDLRAAGVRLFPVASSGVGLKAEFLMRSAAFQTMGQYLFLTDHSGIGNPHAKPHTSQYLVEHLDQLMVRMITSELCGRRLQPDEVLAIERGDMDLPYGPLPIEPGQQQWHEPTRATQSASLALPEGIGLWATIGFILVAVCAYDAFRARQEA